MRRPAAVFVARTVPLFVTAGLALGFALVQGCAKRLPPQEPDAGRIEQPSPPSPAVGGDQPASPPLEKPNAGKAGPPPQKAPAPGQVELAPAERQIGARISTYYLSAGDEIRISVYGYAELDRTVRIPPDGHLFFPMVGDIGVDGMSIPELRQVIADGLRAADEQRIGSGDQIAVRVYRNDDLSVTTVVPSSGRVNLPLAGEVDLVGLTVGSASQAIAERLVPYVLKPSVSTTIQKSASGMPGRIADPHVIVEVMAFGGHKILVLGEVQRPGVYVNDGGSRLLEILAKAGGPTDDAKLTNVALVRPATETSPARTALLNLERTLKSGDLDQNPPVQRGDVIYVPKTTIANVAQFFRYLYDIVRPIATAEYAIWLGQNIEAGPARVNSPATVPLLSFPSPSP
jgi:protein involved in polysaccharide export with SLBB domain